MTRRSDTTETPRGVERRQAHADLRPTDTRSSVGRTFITPPTLAGLLGVSARTVTRWCRQGRIEGAEQFVGTYSTWRIPIEALEHFGLTDLSDSSESGRISSKSGE